MVATSCFSNIGRNLDNRDSDLYNRIGYKPGSTPYDQRNANKKAKLINSGAKIVPDYYYRRAEKRPPVRKVKKRKLVKTISVNYEPSSRFYNNPYSFKPPAQFPYFDSDQYYIPPRGASNIEYQPRPNNNKLY